MMAVTSSCILNSNCAIKRPISLSEPGLRIFVFLVKLNQRIAEERGLIQRNVCHGTKKKVFKKMLSDV
jgi:hypothetical protein